MPELTKVQTGFLEPQGPFKLDTGTAGAPGVYFEGDETTGFYRTAEDEIGVSIDGTQKYNFTSEGLKFNGTSLDGTPFMGAIDKDITDTAVDIFIYDTSKDSDGGAWRHRTSHTSWYNETLNTATRGSRREFPAVAVIVAESTQVTIYDGDDPDLPMWMVFNKPSAGYTEAIAYGNNIRAVYHLNGKLSVSTNDGHSLIDFISEDCRTLRASTQTNKNAAMYGGIVNRNGNMTFVTNAFNSSYNIANSPSANDVAMTVLPSAPIDDATGLPIPTIAVATTGGVSVIKDDGTVENTDNAYIDRIGFIKDDRIGYGHRGGQSYTGVAINIAPFRNSITYGGYINQTIPSLSGSLLSDFPAYMQGVGDGNFYGYFNLSAGIRRINENITSSTNGMANYITTSYNTGWMHGATKGAFLSDTDATNVTGTELVTNGTFASALGSEWTLVTGSQGGTITVNGSNQLVITQGSNSVAMYATQPVTTVVGKRYVANVDVISTTEANYFRMWIGTSANASNLGTTGTLTTAGNYSVYFTATSTTTYITLNSDQNATRVTTWDNASVRLAEEDRSVNNKGLQVFGTVTKSPVATGAELVAYSGFSSSNYLRQSNNTDLNVGTGDFHIMCWVKGNLLMLWHRRDSGTLDMRCEFPISGGNTNKPRFLFSNGGVSIDFYATVAFDTTTWRHCVWVKRGARQGELYIDGILNNSSTAGSDVSLNGTNSTFSIGARADSPSEAFNGYTSLFRFGASAPSAAQIKKIYEDEKVLFQENAACTLYGSSDDVTALAYDEVTERLHVGTSSGRSEFQGLRRINNTTTAVTTAISAYDSFVVEQ